ncbi:MAG TPA: hypothetical protein VHF47_06605 [Acidimicrobiales bacterium]|nr:hypothetical protein [Acidimicrobiales bacterium]
MSYDRFHDDLLLLYGGPTGSAANANTFLYRLDVSVPPPTAYNPQDVQKMYRIRSCTGPVTSTDAGADTSGWDILVTERYLYVPCQRAGHTVIVVRMERPDGAEDNERHGEDVTAGPVYGSSVLADHASGRLFVTTYVQREIWVFETSTMSFVGVVPTARGLTDHDMTGFGLDSETGRVFFQSPTFGLGVAEGRFFPLPQARTLPRLTTGQERILSDARTGRVFVLEGDSAAGTTTPRVAAYKIYKTDAAPVPPPAPDPDRNTADTAEREGVTEARYNGSASGYGSRALLAKGYATVAPAPTAGVLVPTFMVVDLLKGFCGYTDRDIFAGRVAKTEYDTGSTAAEAIAARIDDTTRQDLNQASRCTLPALGDALGAGWAYKPAACASNEGMDVPEVKAQGDNGGRPALGSASVVCPRPPGGRLTAEADSRLTGVVAVDRSWTKTAVERTASGLVSTVTAVAEGINIADTIFIAEVRSTATSASNGRPRRNQMSIHDVSVRGVRVGTQDLCAAECNLQNLERDLNALAAGRIVFRTGKGPNSGLDQALLEGSPKGAQTAVQKSVARQASDRALVGDFTTEIPAFEMTVFNDNTNWGRARQIYQFAGVSSSATYNVVVRPSFVDPDLPSDAGGGDLGTPELGGTPFDGTVEGLSGGGAGFESQPAARTVLADDEDDDDGNPIVRALQAVARGLRLFLTSPRHALLLLTAWALLGSPAVLGRRRRLLAGVRRA